MRRQIEDDKRETNQDAQERLVSEALKNPSVKDALEAYAAIQKTAVVLHTQVAKVYSSAGANI
jgi:hypothetical protein